MTQLLATADDFLQAAQSGHHKDAIKAADRALRGGDEPTEKTRAYAVLTYLHGGRFGSAKAQGKKLAAATGREATWATAALAVAFKPKRAAEPLARLHEQAPASNEYALLAGVHAFQNGDDETGQRLLDGATINPHSVFVTAAALGLRRRANVGANARIFQVLCGLVGLALLSLVGLLLGLAAAEAVNRRSYRRATTGNPHILMSIDTPRERHSGREVARVLGICVGIVIAMAVVLWAVVELL